MLMMFLLWVHISIIVRSSGKFIVPVRSTLKNFTSQWLRCKLRAFYYFFIHLSVIPETTSVEHRDFETR